METEYLTCAETAKLLRKALAIKFPGIKFSVRSKVYSGGASIDVGWTDGPGTIPVEKITSKFEGASFDGMIDLKSYHKSIHPETGQLVHFGADYIFTRRTYTRAYLQPIINRICKQFGLESLPTLGTDNDCWFAEDRSQHWLNDAISKAVRGA